MSTAELEELGRRLRERRREAGFEVTTLAQAALVQVAALEAFEAGHGGLGSGALVRLARTLGVPEGSFLHTAAEEVPARREPTFVLSEKGQAASLSQADRAVLTAELHRARSFAELGEILACSRLARQFEPRTVKGEPYSVGYDLARRVRGLLGNPTAPLRDIRRCMEDDFNILVVQHRFDDVRIQAAACRSGEARLVAVAPSLTFEASRRVILAHELAHQLADLSEDGVHTDVQDRLSDGYSAERSPEEKRARAFAVMLLAPAEAVRELLGSRKTVSFTAARDVISAARHVFGVGFAAMAWHFFHLRMLDFSEDAVTQLVSEGDGKDVSGFETLPPEDGLERRIHAALAQHAISEGRARVLRGTGTPFAA